MYHTDLETLAALVFSDLPPAEGLVWAKRFARHSAAAFADPLTHAGYRDFPVSYLVCEKDKTIPPAVQRAGIATIEEAAAGAGGSGRKVDVTALEADHVPMVSELQKVVDWIVRVAEKHHA